ncbi:MAG: DUF4397 domain-containing protein [Myxococcota bacterium]
MIRKTTLGVAIVAVLGFALVGCSDDSDNGTGGSGGTAGSGGDGGSAGAGGEGGMGGGLLGGGTVTAVHLAPEVPTAEDTEVEIYVNGEGSGVTISYAESTGRVELPAGEYSIGIGLPEADEPLLSLDGVMIDDGTDLTAVAYAVTPPGEQDPPFSVLVFNTSSDGLESGNGRVFVGHGANDPALDPVNIVTVDTPITECMDLIPDFAFGTIFPSTGTLDVPAGELTVAFNVAETCPPVFADLGVTVPVTEDVVSVVVAVDEDTGEGLAPQLYGMIDAGQPVPLIPTE